MIFEEITFLQLVEVTFVSGVDFHLGGLKLARLQQRHVVPGFFCVRGQCFCPSLPCSLTNTYLGKNFFVILYFATFIPRSSTFLQLASNTVLVDTESF